MKLQLLSRALLVLAGLATLVPAAAEDAVVAEPKPTGAGQADFDAAIDAKLSANELDDFATVLDLCRRAVKKGLSEDDRRFAEDLYTGTLVDRAGMVVDAIFAANTPDPQWPRMRSFALRDLNEALERAPKLGAAQLMLARLEALPGGNRDRARKAAEAAIELISDDKLQLAQAHVVRGNLEDVDRKKRAADYDKAVELAPRDKDIRRTRGLFHLLNDEFEKCRNDLAVAIEVEPDDASLQEAMGMAYMMDDKLDEALQAFDKAIELDPAASGALLQRARVLAQRGERPRAIADLDKAIEIAPDDAIPLVLRARIHQQSGDTDQAARDIERVLQKHPDHPAALELRGLIAADRRDYPAAIRDFRKLVAKNGDDPLLVGQLGMLYLAARQPREAIRRFSRALELDENQFLSRRGRSDAEISIGDHKATLAAGHAESGDFDKAREYSRKAVETTDGGPRDTEPDVKTQLASELASYEANKPWRERQEMEDEATEATRPGLLEAAPLDAADGPREAGAPDAGDEEEPSRPRKKRAPRRPFD